MEAANVHNKLILAVVQEDDYDTTVSELNQNGFFVTMLSSTGGHIWSVFSILIGCAVYFEAVRWKTEADHLLQCDHAHWESVRCGNALRAGECGAGRRDCVYHGSGAAGEAVSQRTTPCLRPAGLLAGRAHF